MPSVSGTETIRYEFPLVSTPVRADEPVCVRATASSSAVHSSMVAAPGGEIAVLSDRITRIVTLAVARASLFRPPIASMSPLIQLLLTSAMSISSRSSWSYTARVVMI